MCRKATSLDRTWRSCKPRWFKVWEMKRWLIASWYFAKHGCWWQLFLLHYATPDRSSVRIRGERSESYISSCGTTASTMGSRQLNPVGPWYSDLEVESVVVTAVLVLVAMVTVVVCTVCVLPWRRVFPGWSLFRGKLEICLPVVACLTLTVGVSRFPSSPHLPPF